MRGISLFTGSGIGDYAAEQCGIETVVQCENDPACLYCLERLFPGAIRFEDVHDVSAKSLRERGATDIDIISGGFPCQNLSCAGKGEGIEGSRSGLWREMFRVIFQVRPRWILIENVPALRLRGVDRVIAPLERIGYTVWPLVVGAWAVGAPHKRDRVWIVGRLVDAETIGRSAKGSRRDRCEQGVGSTTTTVADAAELLEGRRSQSSAGLDPTGLGSTPRNARCNSGTHPKGPEGMSDLPSVGRERRKGDALGGQRISGEGSGEGSGEFARSSVARTVDAGKCDFASDDDWLDDILSCGGTIPIEPELQRWRPRVVADTLGGVRSGGGNVAEREPDRGTLACWPSRPCEPQHLWEAPRLIEQSLGCEFDGFPARVQRRANKAALRVLGNAWCYQNALIIFRWIAEQEK